MDYIRQLARDPDQLWQVLTYLSMFGLILALWFAGIVIWYLRRSRYRDRLQGRLGLQDGIYRGGASPADEGAGERILRLWHDGSLIETAVPLAGPRSMWQWLEQVRQDAGWQTPMPRIIFMLALISATLFLISVLVLKNLYLGIALVAAIVFVFRIVLLRSLGKRQAIFEKQLVDSLDLGARSLRAGHPLSGAFRLMAEEMEDPVGTMFAAIVEQESLGLSVQDALKQAADRSRSTDMRIFAASVIIQLRSGGNLADMMERVAWVVRERMRLHRRARVLTAEAQLSKWVLLALPIALFIALNFLNRKYMAPFFTHSWGNIMIIAAICMMLVGGWVMGRMARLKY